MEFLDFAMAITRWEPLRGMEDLLDRYNRSMAYPFGRSGDVVSNSEWCPRVDIAEMNDAFKIKAEIPGVKKEDVHVTLDNGVLTLEGERRQHREEDGFRFHRVESEYGNFIRSFTLPANVKSSGLKAHYHDGILELDIPKAKESQVKAMAIPVE